MIPIIIVVRVTDLAWQELREIMETREGCGALT